MEPTDNPQGRYSHRSSHSGPLVNRSQWTKARKNDDGTPKISAIANLSALSGLVAARRNLLPDDGSEKIADHSEAAAPSGRFSESGNDPTDNVRKYDQLYHMHAAGSQRREDDRSSNMDHSMVSRVGVLSTFSTTSYSFFLETCVWYRLSICSFS